jgi:DNA recombination protein RmuC
MTESIPYLLMALAAIGVAAWFAYRAAQAQEAAAAAKARFEGVDMIRAERDRAVAECETLRGEASRLGAELAAEKAAAATRQAALEDQAKAIESQFVALATQALEANRQSFMALANETFERHKQAAQGEVKDVVVPAQEALAKLAGTVDAMEKARLADKSALNEQMRAIGETLRDTQNATGKLANALRQSPKARGRWGEQTLRNVLELSGLSPHADFSEQTTIDADGAKLRPDVTIRLPGGRVILIDSKVAISAYLDAMDATEEVARETLLRKHAQEMRTHVQRLGEKAYQDFVAESADFVAMFVPGENFFAAAAERDPDLFEFAATRKIIIVTPATLVALAKAIAYGWRQEESARNAQKIADLGRELYTRIATMGKHMSDVGDAINRSVSTYNALVASVESRVLPQARKFRDLGAGSSQELPEAKQIETAPRLPAPPEQLELTPPPQTARRAR